MSCWQRPEWAEFFQCASDHLTEPVSIEFPFGLIYLAAILIGGSVGVALVRIQVRLFGRNRVLGFATLFQLIGDLVFAAWWYPYQWYRRMRERRRKATLPEADEMKER